MADLTQQQVHYALADALQRESNVLRPDRRLWGNREATWATTERAYRFEHVGEEDLNWYRHTPGGRQRISEGVVIHLTHRLAADPSRTELQAGEDKERIIHRLLTDSDLRATSMRIYIDSVDVAESDSGDHLETDIAIRVEYDRAITEVT